MVAGDGVELAVRDYGGTGVPILLLPGGGGTVAGLNALARHLLAEHRVLAMDLRNHGRSGDGPWTWDAVLADVRAVVEHFGLERPVVAGHSLGGMVAALYFDRYGDLTAAVNLDGHGPGRAEHVDLDRAEAEALGRAVKASQLEQTRAMLQPVTAEQLAALTRQQLAMAEHAGLDVADAREAIDRAVGDNGDGTFSPRPVWPRALELSEAIEQLDLLSLYRRVPGPLLVYHAVREPAGELPPDVRTYLSALRRGLGRALAELERDCPHVQVITLDATHGLIAEEPELIAKQIHAFVVGQQL